MVTYLEAKYLKSNIFYDLKILERFVQILKKLKKKHFIKNIKISLDALYTNIKSLILHGVVQ